MAATGPIRKGTRRKTIPPRIIKFNPKGIQKILALQNGLSMQKASMGNPKAARLIAEQTRPLSERNHALQSFHGQTLRILRFEKEIMHTALDCPTEWIRFSAKSKKDLRKKLSEKNREIAAEVRELTALEKQENFRVHSK